MRNLRSIPASLCALAILGALLTACEPPNVFLVDSVVDAVDADPGDGACQTAAGECTLRAAIQEASALGESTEIRLVAATSYVLGLTGASEDLGATGDLDTTGIIHITGNGATIDGNATDRVIDHHDGILFLDHVVVRNGRMSDGAGVRNAAELTIVDSEIRYHAGANSGSGGAILQTAGTLNLARSLVTEYSSQELNAGGVVQLAGHVNIADSVITGNIAVGTAYEFNQLGGTARIVNSTLKAHSATVTVTYCGPFGCIPLPVTLLSEPVRANGTLQIGRTTLDAFDVAISGSGNTDLAGTLILGRCLASVTSSDHNASTSPDCLDAGNPSDIALASDPLDANGVPIAGEPIVDAIPPGTEILCDGFLPHDRRQLPRPQGAGCDIGAIERQPSDP